MNFWFMWFYVGSLLLMLPGLMYLFLSPVIQSVKQAKYEHGESKQEQKIKGLIISNLICVCLTITSALFQSSAQTAFMFTTDNFTDHPSNGWKMYFGLHLVNVDMLINAICCLFLTKNIWIPAYWGPSVTYHSSENKYMHTNNSKPKSTGPTTLELELGIAENNSEACLVTNFLSANNGNLKQQIGNTIADDIVVVVVGDEELRDVIIREEEEEEIKELNSKEEDDDVDNVDVDVVVDI
eukprot:Pgem_evm2s19260